jgi:RNA polymerase sigma factor (sigma-70 family)
MMPSSPYSDGELVARSLRGESEAFGDLYNRYFPSVYDFLHRTMRNADDAADLTQETFLRAMQNLRSLTNPAAFKSWVFSIAHHQALNRLERQKRFIEPSASIGDEKDADPFFCQVDTDRLANPEQAAEMKETARLVWESAASLDKRTYAVLDLYVRQGLESAEIAEVLGVSKGNAYTMLNRMKRSLEEAIGIYLLMRRGSNKCEKLQRIVAPFAIPPVTVDMRKTVQRHVRKCDVCAETRRTLMAPLAVFGAFACVPAPEGLRERIWSDLAVQWAHVGPPSYPTVAPPKARPVSKIGRARTGLVTSVWGGRRLLLALGAAVIVALVPIIFVMSSVSLPGGGAVSPAEKTATATKRPTAVRTPTKPATATVVRTPTVSATPSPAATTPPQAPSATPRPVAAKPTTKPTAAPSVQPTERPRPTDTPEPTRTRFPTDTPRPTRTPEPTIPLPH